MDGVIWHWCTLNLEFTANLVASCSGLFGYHLFYPTLPFVICFLLAATSRLAAYTPMDLKLLNNMSKCSYRNIKLFGDLVDLLGQPLPLTCLSRIFLLVSWENYFHIHLDTVDRGRNILPKCRANNLKHSLLLLSWIKWVTQISFFLFFVVVVLFFAICSCLCDCC